MLKKREIQAPFRRISGEKRGQISPPMRLILPHCRVIRLYRQVNRFRPDQAHERCTAMLLRFHIPISDHRPCGVAMSPTFLESPRRRGAACRTRNRCLLREYPSIAQSVRPPQSVKTLSGIAIQSVRRLVAGELRLKGTESPLAAFVWTRFG